MRRRNRGGGEKERKREREHRTEKVSETEIEGGGRELGGARGECEEQETWRGREGNGDRRGRLYHPATGRKRRAGGR